jgi:hypothetical protein
MIVSSIDSKIRLEGLVVVDINSAVSSIFSLFAEH